MGLRDTRFIHRIAIHPRNPDIVFVAAPGHRWGPNQERGLYRTLDGGRTWQKVPASSHRLMDIFYWDELSASGLDAKDAYRLLLGVTGRATREILVAERETVAGYRREDMELGFPEVAALLAKRGIWV